MGSIPIGLTNQSQWTCVVKTLESPAEGNKIYYDTKVRGFGRRVTAAGHHSFILNYRTGSGRERRHTIGDAWMPDRKGTHAPYRANRLASLLSKNVQHGDPLGFAG